MHAVAESLAEEGHSLRREAIVSQAQLGHVLQIGRLGQRTSCDVIKSIVPQVEKSKVARMNTSRHGTDVICCQAIVHQYQLREERQTPIPNDGQK